ncbi:hypothetical protein OJAV_G00208850 [Oryzias javanicus]|uniref:TIR domain-containing protein n=1 Tax=Oryzias javanicus TaxID=123683 RepID=A0A3S2LPK8_ORYJA|nr:hypothetical protein OJAV_G00208850 [Oryzias javanicus]
MFNKSELCLLQVMDALLLLLITAVVTFANELPSDTSGCYNMNTETFRLLEGEAFYFLPFPVTDLDLPDENFTWYKNNSKVTNITTEEENSIHYHGGALFFINISSADSGHYTARQTLPSGNCQFHHVTITVFNSSSRGQTNYGPNNNTELNKRLICPTPVIKTCHIHNGTFTWYKDGSLIEGENKWDMMIDAATKAHEGTYTCICTWTHNHREHNSSGSRSLVVRDPVLHQNVEILSPVNSEQLVDEGSSIKLNCSILCGINVAHKCKASWKINEKEVSRMDGYHQSINTTNKMPSNHTYSTSTLTIDRVSAQDFQHVFKCFGEGQYTSDFKTVTLKARESAVPLVIRCVCVLVGSVFAVVFIKCFAIDLVLFFRPFFPQSRNKKDPRMYDAYVVYQTEGLQKDTEEQLFSFVTSSLPSVLEDKFGYRLFIHGRDDIPGEDRLELVENCIKESKRLMVILTPASGSNIKDKPPFTSPETSVVGGFDWQIGLYHALVQNELKVILIQLGDPGPQGYTHHPPGLQHLIRKSAPIRWPEGCQRPGFQKSRFWKRVRYLMPVTPAKNQEVTALV